MKPLAISVGDPAGVGPEIVAKAVAQRSEADYPVTVFVQPSVWQAYAGLTLATSVRIAFIAETSDEPITMGVASKASGLAALASLTAAASAVNNGECAALVTAPINKQAISLAGCPHPGHTEWLAEFCGGVPVAMLFASERLNVLLTTIHVSLKNVVNHLSQAQVSQAITMAIKAAHNLGIKAPRIAVAGLNPHASEDGLFGDEEALHIRPAILAAQAQGLPVSGPYPPDTVFMRAYRGEFDLVVAMTHDHGLIAVKLLGWDKAVNVTIGLPFLRASVDHGTAYDIAGRGLADEGNLVFVLAWVEKALADKA
jgi:4-hydroxythreonine-4-phosphate dehydrogenase